MEKILDMLSGWKTILLGFVPLAIAIMGLMGVTVTEVELIQHINNLGEWVSAGVAGVYGLLIVMARGYPEKGRFWIKK